MLCISHSLHTHIKNCNSFAFLLLLFTLCFQNAYTADYMWSPTILLNDNITADWNINENWTPQGIPTTQDTATFATSTNISSISNLPVTITTLRIDGAINVNFVSSLSVSSIVRVTADGGTLAVNGPFSVGSRLELVAGTIQTLSEFSVNGTFLWQAGQIYVSGDAANIDTFTVTGSSGYLTGNINILRSGSFQEASRFLGAAGITVTSTAVLELTLSDNLQLMQFTPQQNSFITNNGNISVSFSVSDTSSVIRFGITPLTDGSSYSGYPTVALVNNGNIVITGSGFLEVSTYQQNSGSLVLSGYFINQLGLRTIPSAITNINGGIISGNGWIDSDVVMASGTTLYLSVSSNFTITRLSMVGNSVIQSTFFDTTLHGILITSSFNARTNVGGILRVVFGNGPNAQIVAGSGYSMVMRDVRVRRGETILFIAPIQFTSSIPFMNLLDIEVERDRFALQQVPVQFSTAATVYFFNVTRVDCENQCSNAGVCVYSTYNGGPKCQCDASSDDLSSDCSRRSYAFLAWIIGPALFAILIVIELIYCHAEKKNRRDIIRNPDSVTFVRPEISAFRAKHRHSPWARMSFDFASLFLFTTEYEGSARTFDLLSKILLTSATVAVGLLAIIPFGGSTSSVLQPIFTGINAGLTFTIAAVQLGWSAMKPRKVEFDIRIIT